MIMAIGIMSYAQTIRLMQEFANDLQIEIDLSDYTTSDEFEDRYTRFEDALAKKVDTETYTDTMRQIEESIENVKNGIFPIDLSSEEQITNTLDISHGGTSATTSTGAQFNLLSDLTVKVSGLDDEDYFIYSKPDQSKENGAVGKLRASHMWNWVKDKMQEDDWIPTDTSAIPKDKIDLIF